MFTTIDSSNLQNVTGGKDTGGSGPGYNTGNAKDVIKRTLRPLVPPNAADRQNWP